MDIANAVKSAFKKKENVLQNPGSKMPLHEAKPLKEKVEKRAEKKILHISKKSFYEQKRFFEGFIQKAGIEHTFDEINKKIMYYSGTVLFILLLVVLYRLISIKTYFSDSLIIFFCVAVLGGVLFFLVGWAILFVYVDVKIYQRKKEIEAVFPDFLQLTAANINAGMPIDRALWFAIRPRFGILAKEMEDVAKATMVGENLSVALRAFSNRYDSIIIKRALNLLLEGLESGGEVGELLTRVANNIRDTEILKKEMASSVTTYVIFILFATLGAAPFLFGLTTELIVIMKSILGGIKIDSSGGGMGGMFTMSADAISLFDYQFFVVSSLCISSTFAAIIISVIQKGNAREALKNIPIYILIALTNYYVSYSLMRMMLGGMFK